MERAPRFRLTHLLAAAIWLCFKKKFLNEDTAKYTCRKFTVREKQLSKILSWSRYKGGTDPKGPAARGKKWKSVPAKKPDEKDEEEDDPQPSAFKEDKSAMKGRPN